MWGSSKVSINFSAAKVEEKVNDVAAQFSLAFKIDCNTSHSFAFRTKCTNKTR
jgi:hypothetical protein